MAKVQTIKIRMTDEQMRQLEPLFEITHERPLQGFVIAQVWESGVATVGFVTPERVKQGMEKHLESLSQIGETSFDA